MTQLRPAVINRDAAQDATCNNCEFFDSAKLLCRNSPPVVIIDNNQPVTFWPTVAATDWCGSWLLNS